MLNEHKQKTSSLRQVLIWIILLIIPATLMFLVEYRHMGSIGHQTPDACVYISIADNYLETGHFIQNYRDVKGMVVPPGVPLVLTVFRLLHFSNQMIIAIQVLMFWLCNVLLYETANRIATAGIWAPIMYTMAYMRCWLGLGLFLVEHYYLFLICLALWVLYQNFGEKKKVILLNFIGIAMMMTRPLLSVVYFTIFFYSIFWCWKQKKLRIATGCFLLPIVCLTLNLAVNYRETGEFILLENYSGLDFYTATRIDAPIYIEEASHFGDDVYFSIVNDETLTMSDRNVRFMEIAKANLKDHFGLYLKNAILRGHEIFMKAYAWATLYTLIGGILLSEKERKAGTMRATGVLILTVILAIVSSFGVPEVRYSMVIWPMASIHGSYLTNQILYKIRDRIHRNALYQM